METLPEFIRIYRQSHPDIPILVVSKFPYADEIVDKQVYDDRIERLNFQMKLIEQLKQDGDQNFTFMREPIYWGNIEMNARLTAFTLRILAL